MIDNIIFDFDSTIINAESVEMVIRETLERADKTVQMQKIVKLQELSRREKNGDIPLGESLHQRFSLAEIRKRDIESAAKKICKLVDPFVRNTIRILQNAGKRVFIFSNSFEELVYPVTDLLKVDRSQVYTNELIYNREGRVVGIDENNPLFLRSGKGFIAEQLKISGLLPGGTAVVGNSISDLSIRKNNVAKMFVYFAGGLTQEEVRREADFSVDHFDQLLTLFFSDAEFPNEKAREIIRTIEIEKWPHFILLENIHPNAIGNIERETYEFETHKNAWTEQELIEKAVIANVLGIRSQTHITKRVINNLPHLWVIGAFCIGTNQIDLSAAANAGIPVFNAPYSNTRSVAELVVGEIIILMRRIFEKSHAAHEGRWLKSATGCSEIRGKIVGIIGYGHIGSQVSVLLESLGISVIFHDIVDKLPLGNAQKALNRDELLQRADVVTLHVPDTPETRGMIGKEQIMRMKKGAFLINSSRGKVVDLEALREALDAGHLAGAAIDVFPAEPKVPDSKFSSVLQGSPNVILTPHIGGSTKEAQENIAAYVSDKLVKYVNSGATTGAINFPEVDMPRVPGTHRILHVHSNVPGVLAKINSVFARRNINIESQILQTKENIGYLIVDVDQQISVQVLRLMGHITETIKVRRIA